MMADGWHRRAIRQWHHTRLVVATILNVNRAEKTPAIAVHEVLWLPGDPAPPAPMEETEYDSIMARLAAD